MTEGDRRNMRLQRIADQINGHSARLVHDANAHISREIAISDGWASATMGDGTPRGASELTLVERIADRRYRLDMLRDEIHCTIEAIEQLHESLVVMARSATGIRIERIEGRRCSGAIDPTCTNWAAEQHHPITGEQIDTLCVACWQQACPICKYRPADTRRPVDLDGRKVPGCEACRRKQTRAAKGVAA